MLHAALGLLRLPRRALILATMAGVLGYMVLVGSSPSVVRAAVMACVVLGGRLIERPVDVLQSLGVAASIVLLSDPVELFDPGFQLSFAAVFAIVTLSGLWRGAARRIPRHTWAGRVAGALFQLLTVSASAQIGTMPIALLLFERISVVSLAANLVVVPLSSVNVALGISTLVFDHISAALAAPYAAANDLIAHVVLDVAALASSVPGASISTAGWSPFAAIAIPVVLLGVLSIRRVVIVKACLLIVLALATGWLFQSLSGARPAQLAVTVLDVGQGDAILIESPDGVRVLLDGGPAGLASDAGQRIIVPYLARRGINRLEAVILSHGHSDHIGGIASVLEQVSVARLLVASEEVPGATAERVVETARGRGTRLERIARGTALSVGSSVRLYVLHPPHETAPAKTLNNISIVCKLVYGDVSMLFAGDIETAIEDDLVHRYGSFLRSDLLKVAHHGSATSSSPSFLDAVAPETAVISVGWRNRFYHPSPGTLREFARRGIRTLRTDRFGAIIIASDGKSVTAAPWRDH
jgi:competence protein ComEC